MIGNVIGMNKSNKSIPEIERRRLVAVEGLQEGLVGQPHRADARRRLVHRDRVAQRDDSPGVEVVRISSYIGLLDLWT